MGYDICIVGGGIVGASLLRDASLRGLKAVLFEKDDFASGASSKSSKLAHGGLRYLESFELSLVKSSLRERSLLLKNDSPLVNPLQFYFPLYAQNRYPQWLINLGLIFYDKIASGNPLPEHKKLSPDALFNEFPDLEKGGIKGVFSFYDAQMDDARLVIENLKSARKEGGEAYNYTVQKDVKSRATIYATGAWSEKATPYKGVHIVIPQIHPTIALLLRTPQDNRVFFVIPWHGYSLVGTTDTPYHGTLENISASAEDESYLLKALSRYFPKKGFERKDIISSFAGLRPLVKGKNGSRDHSLQVEGTTIHILGGKYTTAREMAEEALDKAFQVMGEKLIPCQTQDIPLFQKTAHPKPDFISDKIWSHLEKTYPNDLNLIAKMVQEHPALAKPLHPSFPHIQAELEFGKRYEWVKTLDDWLYRRSYLGLLGVKKEELCLSALQSS